MQIPFCGSAEPKALAVFFISLVALIIGSSLVWNTLIAQTPQDDRYEGFFNSANFHVFTLIGAVGIQSAASFYQYGGFASKAWKYMPYFLVGILILWISGSLEPQAGKHAWISMSYASINSLRIGLEAEVFTGFARTEVQKALGLVDNNIVISGFSNSDTAVEDQEDYRSAFIGVMFLLIALVLSGSVSNGAYGMPFKGKLGSAGWSKNYQASVVASFVALMFGFCATFVAWSSDAASNPSHPFYETVMGMASYSIMAAFCVSSAISLESRLLAEISLFLTGFFLLQAPVKCWQLATFSEEPTIRAMLSQYSYTDSSGEYTNAVVSAELDRYKSTTVLNMIQAVFTIYAAMKFLNDDTQKSAEFDAVGYKMLNEDRTANTPVKKNIMHYVFITLGAILAVVGNALSWSTARQALKSIDADETYRMDAVNWYILMLFVAEFCVVVQFFEIALPTLKPLWWVAAGIISTCQLGFSNIGTHDRQLWFIDYSFAGLNELRALLMHETEYVDKRAVGVDEGEYDQAFAGVLLFWMGFVITWMFTMKFPLSACGSTTNWNRNTGLYSFAKLKSSQTIFVIFGLLLYVIALSVLMANDLATPAISGAAGSAVNTTDGGVCSGEFFNVHSGGVSGCTFIDAETSQISGDRFTLNTMTSWIPTDRKYSDIFLMATVGFTSTITVFAGWFQGDSRSIKYGLIWAGVMWLALEYAMTFDGATGEYGARYADFPCKDLDDLGQDTGDCEMYKAGMVVMFLAGLCNVIAALIMLGVLDTEIDGVNQVTPSTPSRSIPADAQAITQEELNLAVSTPEKAMELARRIQSQGYLSVVAAEPTGAPAPSTMV